MNARIADMAAGVRSRLRQPWALRTYILGLLAATIVPLVAFASVVVVQFAHSERETDRNQIVGVARALSTAIDLKIGEAERTLEALVDFLPHTDKDMVPFYESCAAAGKKLRGWIVLADRSGHVIFHTRHPHGAALPDIVLSPEAERSVRGEAPRVSDMFYGRIDRQPVVSIYRPVPRRDGDEPLILILSFATGTITDMLVSQGLPPEWTVGVVDRTGRIMARSRDAEKFVGSTASARVMSMDDRAMELFVRGPNLDGTAEYAAVVRSAATGWKTIVGIPILLVDKPFLQALGMVSIAGLVLGGVATATGWWLSRRLSFAMRQLSRAASTIGTGSPVTKAALPVHEVAILADAVAAADARLAATIGELRHAESNARIGEERLRLVIEHAPDALFLYDFAQDRFVDANPAAERLFACPKDELLRHGPRYFYADEQPDGQPTAATFSDHNARALAGEQLTYERRIRNARGQERICAVTLVRVSSLNERLLRASFVDITDRKRSETALAQSEHQLRQISEHLAHAQRIANVGSFEVKFADGRLTWSDETFRIFGLERESFATVQSFIDDMVVGEDRERMAEGIARVRCGDRVPPVEYRIRRRDGSIRTIYREAEPITDGAGAVVGMMGIVRDVTDLRDTERQRDELEAQLRQSQKLEALGTLAGGIAHDINNALVPVLSLTSLLLKRSSGGSRERETLDLIRDGGLRARDLVRRILTFARKEEPMRELLDLGKAVASAVELLRATVPATIAIETRVVPVPAISADEGQLHQVLTNLVTNGAHAIGDGMGTIVIAVEWRSEISLDGGAPSVRLSVSDTGCGMDEATRQRIFDPFFTTKAVNEGTGLGLSVVHGIVAAHGGTITVESALGRGARFDIDFPVAAVAAVDGEAA